MNTIGEMKDVYTIARYVGIPGEKIERFLKAAEMSGYLLVRAEEFSPSSQSAALDEDK